MRTFTFLTKIFALPYVGTLGALLALVLSLGAAQGQSSTTTPIHVSLGAAAQYGLLSGDSINTVAPVFVRGRAGGTVVSPQVTTSDSILTSGSNLAQARADLLAARNYCAGLSGTTIIGSLGGQTLSSGVYAVNGAASCAAGTTLTLSGDSTSLIVLVVGGNMTFHSGSHIRLSGVLPRHVYWNVGGKVTFADNANASGLILAGSTIETQGVQFGTRQLLATGNLLLNNFNQTIGTNTVYSAHFLAGGLGAGCGMPTTPAACDNRVSNGNFENYRLPCPVSGGNIRFTETDSDVCGFTQPGPGTPDYFNACAPLSPLSDVYSGVPNLGVPYNIFTGPTQARTAHSGNGYAGATSGPDYATWPLAGYREYITQELPAYLQPGSYYGEFWVSLTNNSIYSTRQLGMYLSDSPEFFDEYVDPVPIPALPTPQLSGSPKPWLYDHRPHLAAEH